MSCEHRGCAGPGSRIFRAGRNLAKSIVVLKEWFLFRRVDRWHSWDETPWNHPWLTREKLSRIREFSREVLDQERRVLEWVDPEKLKVGFVGNIANAMYTRAVPLRRAGMDVSIFLHPQDTYAMSYPGWEELDAVVEDGEVDVERLRERGLDLMHVPDVYRYPEEPAWRKRVGAGEAPYLRPGDIRRYPDYLHFLDTLDALQAMDVLWGTQCGYLAYLANRPYVISQSGGDAWLEASRGDMLGQLMRAAFARARLWLVSNPWSFAHARRYGISNLVYLPKMLDETVYRPGHGESRNVWEARVGGDFFVLTSSRLDERNKGSTVGLEGFAAFSRLYPEARFVVIGWGRDRAEVEKRLRKLDILDKVVLLPLSTKGRLRDYLRSADVFMDQFVLGYFGSAGLEAMACGLPLIGRLELEQYGALSDTGAPPALTAETPEEVSEHLLMLARHPERRREIGVAVRQWFLDNHGSGRRLDDHRAVLAATAVNAPLDLSESPLRAKLDLQERIYHLEGRRKAPPFPNYGW